MTSSPSFQSQLGMFIRYAKNELSKNNEVQGLGKKFKEWINHLYKRSSHPD
jgi:hypothetical protein